MYVLVQNNEIEQFGLPQVGTLKDGRMVSNFDLLPQEVLKLEGWFPLEDNKPTYDETTEMLQFQSYDIQQDKVIANYIAIPIPQPNLNDIKNNKINELNTACNQEILGGFYSSAKGGIKHKYSFSDEDQINMIGIQNRIYGEILLKGSFTGIIEWKNDEQVICDNDWTVAEYMQLCADAEAFKTDRIKQYHSLKEQVLNAITKEEIDAIVWTPLS